MEHEVFVPVPPDRLGEALADPARVARAIPGLQRDASAGGAGGGDGALGADSVVGRLKVRVGGTTITYHLNMTVMEELVSTLFTLWKGAPHEPA